MGAGGGGGLEYPEQTPDIPLYRLIWIMYKAMFNNNYIYLLTYYISIGGGCCFRTLGMI